MYRLCLAFALVIFIFSPLRAESILPDNLEITSKLNLFWAQAHTPASFADKYHKASAKIDVDLSYNITENFDIVFLPYIQTSYDINRTNKTETKVKIWQGYFDYKISNFNFTLGRFAFADENLAPFVYYGERTNLDLALPTSLDGIKHSFESKYLTYTLLAAKETQIDIEKKAKILGANITVKPASWISLSGFYFSQDKDYLQEDKNISENLSLYGGGVNLSFNEKSGLRFYAVQNGGNKKSKRFSITQKIPYEGYALNGEFYCENTYEAGTLNGKLGFYRFSEKKKFYTLPNELNVGIIYYGMNYDNKFPASPKIIYSNFDFNFKKYPFLSAGADIFVYASEKTTLNSRTYYAKELNLNAALTFETWGFKLSGGLFEGEAIFIGNPSTEKQKITKLQARFFYKFGF